MSQALLADMGVTSVFATGELPLVKREEKSIALTTAASGVAALARPGPYSPPAPGAGYARGHQGTARSGRGCALTTPSTGRAIQPCVTMCPFC